MHSLQYHAVKLITSKIFKACVQFPLNVSCSKDRTCENTVRKSGVHKDSQTSGSLLFQGIYIMTDRCIDCEITHIVHQRIGWIPWLERNHLLPLHVYPPHPWQDSDPDTQGEISSLAVHSTLMFKTSLHQ